jgi:SAM-dependent methyltransferase
VLAWSQNKVTQLELQAGNGAADDFERLMAQARLHAAQGELPQAREALLRSSRCGGKDVPYLTRNLIVAAIIAQQTDLAESLLADFLAPDCEVRLNLETNTAGRHEIVTWEVEPQARTTFHFASNVFRTDKTDFLLRRWLQTVPLCIAYTCVHGSEAGAVHLSVDDHGTAPGLAFCDNRPDFFLIPDGAFVETRGYRPAREHFRDHEVEWSQRIPLAIWRGSTTGRPQNPQLGWRSLPRLQLCEIARAQPDLIDAGIVQVAQIPPESESELQAAGLMKPYIPSLQFNRYKFQIDIDGNSNSWAGLFEKLLSGSPVLKIASPFGYRQWYYDLLKPWIHFVPVASDLSDLVEKLQWLRAHDDVAREIGARGRELAYALDYDSEIRRCASTIDAALRFFDARPPTALDFGAPGNTSCLRTGWSMTESRWATALGTESTIVLPRPSTIADHVLTLDVSLFESSALSKPQPLTVVANGALAQRALVTGRQSIRCVISRQLMAEHAQLNIILLHPNATRAASPDCPFDERVVSVRLHGLTMAPLPGDAPRNAVAGTAMTAITPASDLPATRQARVMRRLHRCDVWQDYIPQPRKEERVCGWNGVHPIFKRLLDAAPIPVFVDVGAWKGQASIFVARLMQQGGRDGCVIAVDTFLGSLQQWRASPKWFERPQGRADLFERFLQNVFYSELTHLVVPLAQTPLVAASLLRHANITAGIVHLDASHDYETVLQEAEAFWPLIAPGGHLVGDDYNPGWPGMVRAADELAGRLGVELRVAEPKWFIGKPR